MNLKQCRVAVDWKEFHDAHQFKVI